MPTCLVPGIKGQDLGGKHTAKGDHDLKWSQRHTQLMLAGKRFSQKGQAISMERTLELMKQLYH